MATLGEIRAGIKQAIQAEIDGMNVYNNVNDAVNSPACVVMPDPKEAAQFTKAMARGHDEWFINVYILVARTEAQDAQNKLDRYVSGAGQNSVRQAIYTHGDLFLEDGTDATPLSINGYGGSFDVANTNYVGAVLRLSVITPGTA